MVGPTKALEKAESPQRAVLSGHAPAVRAPGIGVASVPQAAGNLAMQRLLHTGVIQAKLNVSQPGDADEQEAERVAEQVTGDDSSTSNFRPSSLAANSSIQRCACGGMGGVDGECEACHQKRLGIQRKLDGGGGGLTAPASVLPTGGGQPLPVALRARFEPRFGHDFSGVRIHTSDQAAKSAQTIQAHAFTMGQNIVFGIGEYAPQSQEGQRLLAHELTHVVQQGFVPSPKIQRETAHEIHERYKNWGGLNLREEALAEYLVTLTRARNYQLVIDVINDLSSSDRDDVAGEIMRLLLIGGPRELISLAPNADATRLLRVMKNEIGDWWGWITEGEANQANLLGAVINDPGKRDAWNRARIDVLKAEAGTDLEALARLFEDDQIIDDGSVSSRLQVVLGATAHIVIPGLQTGIPFGDTGFAGDQNPGGAGFRDPHPASRNQVGHFLTAVGLQFSPAVVARDIPLFGSIRNMVGAPTGMSDSDVALRLTIGHEKAPDPSGGIEILVNIVATGLIENLLPGPEGETEEQRDERVGRAIEAETRQQIREVIAAFQTQFQATTDADVAAWNEALGALGTGATLDMNAAETPLSRIAINPANRGNSIQDLRLSLVGWRLGQMISNGEFADRAAVATWIRTNLGAPVVP